MVRASCLRCAWKTPRDSYIQAGYSAQEHWVATKHEDFDLREVVYVEERHPHAKKARP